MKTSEKILGLFRRNIIQFLDELISQFPEETDIIVCRIFVCTQIQVEDLMLRMIMYVLPHRGLIEKKDQDYFLKKNDLFSELSAERQGKALQFKRLWVSSRLGKADREAIWDWMNVFVQFALKYQQAIKSEGGAPPGQPPAADLSV